MKGDCRALAIDVPESENSRTCRRSEDDNVVNMPFKRNIENFDASLDRHCRQFCDRCHHRRAICRIDGPVGMTSCRWLKRFWRTSIMSPGRWVTMLQYPTNIFQRGKPIASERWTGMLVWLPMRKSCIINGKTIPHLVIQGKKGPITLLLMPDEMVTLADFAGRKASTASSCRLAMAASRSSANATKNWTKSNKELLDSVEWSI